MRGVGREIDEVAQDAAKFERRAIRARVQLDRGAEGGGVVVRGRYIDALTRFVEASAVRAAANARCFALSERERGESVRTLVAKGAHDVRGITPQNPRLAEQSCRPGRRVDVARSTQCLPSVTKRWTVVPKSFAHAPIVEGVTRTLRYFFAGAAQLVVP